MDITKYTCDQIGITCRFVKKGGKESEWFSSFQKKAKQTTKPSPLTYTLKKGEKEGNSFSVGQERALLPSIPA